MKITALAYTSDANVAFDTSAVDQLTKCASAKNESLGITGYLYYRKQHFFQYIEGEPNSINGLMETLHADDRHSIRQTVRMPELMARACPTWWMKRYSYDELCQFRLEDVLAQVMTSASSTVDPEQVSKRVLSIVDKIARTHNRTNPSPIVT